MHECIPMKQSDPNIINSIMMDDFKLDRSPFNGLATDRMDSQGERGRGGEGERGRGGKGGRKGERERGGERKRKRGEDGERGSRAEGDR